MIATEPSSEQLRDKIVAIITARQAAAAASPYDWKVCVGAVAAARREFEKVSVAGSAQQFGTAVLSRLEKLRDEYYDPDGEFTSGKSEIGTVVRHIKEALKAMSGDGRA